MAVTQYYTDIDGQTGKLIGWRFNPLTTAQRNALDLDTDDKGLFVYDTDEDISYIWNGVAFTILAASGAISHGSLTGLGNDDHPQYHNDARGDVRYAPIVHGHVQSDIVDLVNDLLALQTQIDDNTDDIADINTDLSGFQTQLDGKVDENAPIIAGTNTKITYDTKGLILSGTAATTADVNDSTNRRYVTDAQLVVVGNTSGTNTGDQSLAGLQPLDSDLTAIAALTPTNDDVIQRKAGAWTNRTIAQLSADLGIAAGYQPLDSDLTAIAAIAPANDDFIQRKSGVWTNRTVAQVRTDLALGAIYQPLDSDLTTIAGLTATTDNFMQSKGSAWASRTVAQVKTDLGLTGTNSGDQNLQQVLTQGAALTSTHTITLASGQVLHVSSGTGTPLSIESENDTTLLLYRNGTTTNAITGAITANILTTGTAAAGLGGSIAFNIENSDGTVNSSNQIRSVLTNATAASRVADYEVWGVNAGTLARKMKIAGSGQQTLDAYGTAANTGTPTRFLAVTSAGAVIEQPCDNPVINIMQGLGHNILFSGMNVGQNQLTTNMAHADSSQYMIAVFVDRPVTLTGVGFVIVTPGDYTSDNYNGIGLYSITVGTGDLNLVASSTDDGNIWKAAIGYVTKAFTTPYVAPRGVYYISALYNQSAQVTAPVLAAGASMASANYTGYGFANNLKMVARRTAQATQGSNFNASALITLAQNTYFTLY